MDKQQQLDSIAERIKQDNVCPELREGATQLVFADGNPDADIVFIGEAPGANEDKQGIPFVGAAGKFLNEMLDSIGMSRPDIYITNIVKYRPPANRDPLPEEIAAFMPYLKQQLAVIRPKLVVFLGRHAMSVFMPELKISQAHGQPKRIRIRLSMVDGMGPVGRHGVDARQGSGEERSEAYEQYGERAPEPLTQPRATNESRVGGLADEQAFMSVVVLPLFHPAAALYNGGMRQTLLDDFSKIPKILELIEQEKIEAGS